MTETKPVPTDVDGYPAVIPEHCPACNEPAIDIILRRKVWFTGTRWWRAPDGSYIGDEGDDYDTDDLDEGSEMSIMHAACGAVLLEIGDSWEAWYHATGQDADDRAPAVEVLVF